jgi:exosortase/archaeosortase family protein
MANQVTTAARPASAVNGKSLRLVLSRSELFALLFALTCANGLVAKALDTIRQSGWTEAAIGTFGISAIVWFACYAGLALVVRADGPGPGGREDACALDWIIAAAVLGLAAVPFGALSWAAQACLAIYVIQVSRRGSARSRGAWILLAVTVPMCWSRLLFAVLSRWILEADAILVSSVLGTERIGNTVRFAGEPDFFQIFPACSSLANMSLAILCWVTITQVTRHRAVPADTFWCALACFSVVVVNVARISLIGLHRDSFEIIHGPVGATIAAWIALGLMVGISLWSVRRDFVRV